MILNTELRAGHLQRRTQQRHNTHSVPMEDQAAALGKILCIVGVVITSHQAVAGLNNVVAGIQRNASNSCSFALGDRAVATATVEVNVDGAG